MNQPSIGVEKVLFHIFLKVINFQTSNGTYLPYSNHSLIVAQTVQTLTIFSFLTVNPWDKMAPLYVYLFFYLALGLVNSIIHQNWSVKSNKL